MTKSVTISKKYERLFEKNKSIRLDLGCGDHKQAGFIGLDQRKLPGVDIVHDFQKFPWPIPSNIVRAVILSHVWEHVNPQLTLPFMAELHRVCQDGAQIMVSAPYGVEFRFVQDPTHINPSNEATWCYWDNRHPLWAVYRPPIFHLEAYELIPVGGSRDFNAILSCCKAKKCPHLNGAKSE